MIFEYMWCVTRNLFLSDGQGVLSAVTKPVDNLQLIIIYLYYQMVFSLAFFFVDI